MFLKSISLINFRNYEKLVLSFNNKRSLFIGDNGKGKTNFLEAIYTLGMTKSFRDVPEVMLIQQDKDTYRLKGSFVKGEDETPYNMSAEIICSKKQKTIKINDKNVKKVSDYIGNFLIIPFLNTDIELIYGSPSVRRKYLDMTLSLSYNKYLVYLQNFTKIVKNRNVELRKAKERLANNYSLWNDQLIEYGSYIISERLNFFSSIREVAKPYFDSVIMGTLPLELSYRNSLGQIDNSFDEICLAFKKKLAEKKEDEERRGMTLVGPHKDDFLIKSNGIDFKKYASQGQNRACSLVLKLATTGFIEHCFGENVIYLLDDILLDLDEQKKENFLSLLENKQIFAASTDLNNFKLIKDNSQLFSVDDDTIISQ